MSAAISPTSAPPRGGLPQPRPHLAPRGASQVEPAPADPVTQRHSGLGGGQHAPALGFQGKAGLVSQPGANLLMGAGEAVGVVGEEQQ